MILRSFSRSPGISIPAGMREITWKPPGTVVANRV
jgi:hypothetical protein